MQYNSVGVDASQTSIGAIRERVFAQWRGPTYITAHELGGEPFFGWAVISLDVRIGWLPRLESRSVYAKLSDKSQPLAVLRAVLWDGVEAHGQARKHGHAYQPSLPARFVQISAADVDSWLTSLDAVPTTVYDPLFHDESVPIRRLRVEANYISSVFEKVWQPDSNNKTVLDSKWEWVWQEMERALLISPVASSFEEKYKPENKILSYDFQAYHPRLLQTLLESTTTTATG